jgi:hypothetical protein
MADAKTLAPLFKEPAQKEWVEIGDGTEKEKVVKDSNEYLFLTQEFDATKKYMFELADELLPPTYPTIETTKSGRVNLALKPNRFTPRRNIILTSQIIWNNQRRNIRYYEGCTTIFVDKQPQDKATVDQLIAGTNKNKFLFIDGEWGCQGYERWLLLYMNIASWNVGSPFRTQSANGIFKTLDADRIANATTLKIDQMEEALGMAKKASEVKMKIHSDWLGISDIDRAGNKLNEKQLRALYREEAAKDPETFIKSYGNTAIETEYFIKKAWESGTITNKMNPNMATWGSKNTKVCDISGLTSPDAICQRIFEYSQSEDGAEFLTQLKSLYS